MSHDIIDAKEVSAMLGLAVETFHRKKDDLKKLGFPGPLPFNSRRYSKRAVARWMEIFHDGAAPELLPDGVVALHPAARAAAARRIADRARGAR